MSDDGYNPIRWSCERRGCFNVVARPKVEQFAHLFGGKCSMGDVDYEIERNGFFLRMEWKHKPTDVLKGQARLFDDLVRVSRGKFTVILVAGDAQTMHVTHYLRWRADHAHRWTPWTFEQLELVLSKWELWALNQPRWRG